MWKLKIKNKLFGYDYIIYKSPLGNTWLSEIIQLKDGKVGYWDLTNTFSLIRNPEDVFWLTCSPTKYFNNTSTCVSTLEK